MATPQEDTDTALQIGGCDLEHMNCCMEPLQRPMGADDLTERRMLRSRIEEQSRLICMLKEKADNTLLQYQALQKVNTELEDQVTHCQEELDDQRKRAETLQQRFMDLAANNTAIIGFMEEHKKQNAQLKIENKQLQSENESLFSQKLNDQERLVQKLTEETKLMKEKYADKEIKYKDKLAECESKLLEQVTQHKSKETSLLDQLHEAHQKHADALETIKDLRLKLKETKGQYVKEETSMRGSLTSLTKEKDKLLFLSMERDKVIQEKEEKIQRLETQLKVEKKAKVEAQERFEREADAINKDVKVKSLQLALDESSAKIKTMRMEFDAFKERYTNLLNQEKELNKILRHMSN